MISTVGLTFNRAHNQQVSGKVFQLSGVPSPLLYAVGPITHFFLLLLLIILFFLLDVPLFGIGENEDAYSGLFSLVVFCAVERESRDRFICLVVLGQGRGNEEWLVVMCVVCGYLENYFCDYGPVNYSIIRLFE